MTNCITRRSWLLAPLAAAAFASASAFAAPVTGPSGLAFYTPPSPLPAGTHGDLIWYRSATPSIADAPAFDAWNVLYRSTDAVGADNVVTGTVIVPKTAWSGSGERPVIDYAVGTHGLAQSCAPSLQLAGGTDYEAANIAAVLNAGYAVVITDNPGYTTGDTPTYLAGVAQGHAALDLFKAATQIPSSPISSNAKVALWGFSQGGQTSAWAGQLQGDYAPDMKLTAVAAGGVPADFISSAHYLNGSAGSSFLLGGVIGLAQQYPNDIPLSTLTNSAGQAAIADAKTKCVFQTLFPYMNKDIATYTVNGETLDQLIAIPSVNTVLTAQNLGANRISAPVYLYHGTADEFLPLEQSEALKTQWCKLAGNVTYGVYPSEHIATQFQAAPYVLSWLGDRFSGKPTLGTCVTANKKPVSNANPGGGDLVVSLDAWPLSAVLHLKTLDQDVVVPKESTFSADANMTKQTITADLSIPTFVTKIKLAGIPLSVKLTVKEASQITGSAAIDDTGLLHIHGNAYANLTINSLGISVFRIPFNCSTASPIPFPIDFDGPVSALGNGKLNFQGTTTFPKFSSSGCALAPLFNVLISGPGQTYSYTATPPAPTLW